MPIGMDTSEQQAPIQIDFYDIMEHREKLPLTDDLLTNWNFHVELNGESAGKSSWMFSTKLNKVFVKLDTHLNVYPTYHTVDQNQELFVRAMIVYISKNDLAEPVRKCPNHQAMSSIHPHPEHILKCELPVTQYVGVAEGKLFKDKLALVVPMNAIASNEPLKLKFTCQNSCSGMSRKLTSIVFTLENLYGEIYGRKIMNFKVCSCPKRDKERDEDTNAKNLPKKRKTEQVPSTSKKVAMTVPVVKQETDTSPMVSEPVMLLQQLPSDMQCLNEYEIKQELTGCVLNVVLPDLETKRRALQNVYDLVAGKMVQTGDTATYQPYLNGIRKQIGK